LEDAVHAKRESFQKTAWHEVCHTVVDAWTKSQSNILNKFEPLYSFMTGRAKNQYQGPPGWLHMVDEHIIRAICARLTAIVYGEAEGAAQMEKERSEGFVFIESFYEALRRYELERSQFPTLKDYYPAFNNLLNTFFNKMAQGHH
jgi:hypothetical protein